eukprot:TRINITY_DN121226_c0_g1_i1.p1 TRINITY_DN121226_c0_g1~~TRINITY_DN121226_c0_g1_i1.p1  ORF type:complete len:701 (-),score=162.98 TRINITY_DN121226_c0_g1_i1:23-2125(-)
MPPGVNGETGSAPGGVPGAPPGAPPAPVSNAVPVTPAPVTAPLPSGIPPPPEPPPGGPLRSAPPSLQSQEQAPQVDAVGDNTLPEAAGDSPTAGGGAGSEEMLTSGAATLLANSRRPLLEAPGAERLLHELRDYHYQGLGQERSEFRRVKADLKARLIHLEGEQKAADQIGAALERRLETLQAAIIRGREDFDRLKQGATAEDLKRESLSRFVTERTCQESEGLKIDAKTWRPTTRTCREQLRAQFQEARLSGQDASRPSAAATSFEKPTSVVGGAGGYLRAIAGRSKDFAAAATLSAWSPFSSGTAGGSSGSRSAPSARNDRQGNNAAEHDSAGAAASEAALGGVAETEAEALRRGLQGAASKWSQKLLLRSHLDSVRHVLCDESLGVLLSCGEDSLIKCWDLNALWTGGFHAEEPEPYAVLRRHTAPVLAMTHRPQDRALFSAGMDRSISVWQMPEPERPTAYGSGGNAAVASLKGHEDTVWSLAHHAHLRYLLSASADGNICLWSTEDNPGLAAAYTLPVDEGDEVMLDIPASVLWMPTNVTQFLGGYVSSKVALFDVQRKRPLWSLSPPEVTSAAAVGRASVTAACCHMVSLTAVTAHEDCCARLLDLSSGRFVADFRGHGDAVTSVCYDPAKDNTITTASHDGFVRFFDLRTGRCFSMLRLHDSKYGEAIHSVFHGHRILATAGADGHVGVLTGS